MSEHVPTPAQRHYAEAIFAYRLADKHAARVTELHQDAIAMADKLRLRMENARRALSAEQPSAHGILSTHQEITNREEA